MPQSYRRHKFISVVIDEVTSFMVPIPIHQSRSEETGDALIEHMFSKNSIPEYTIMDQDSAFISTWITYLFRKLGIKIKTITPYNHQSSCMEHGNMA